MLASLLGKLSPSHGRRRTRRVSSPAAETLESRRLLTVYWEFNQATGDLLIESDGDSDTLTLDRYNLNADDLRLIAYGFSNDFEGVTSVTVIGGDDVVNSTVSTTYHGPLFGAKPDYRIEGGSGNDVLNLDKVGASVTVLGGSGNDEIIGSSRDDTLNGGDGNDTIIGGDGDDKLLGRGMHDELRGGDGDDTLQGAGGRDSLYGSSGDDLLEAGGGNDFAQAGSGEDTIWGGAGNDTLLGSNGKDTILGEGGADEIYGGLFTSDTADDVLFGGDEFNDTSNFDVLGFDDSDDDFISGIEL